MLRSRRLDGKSPRHASDGTTNLTCTPCYLTRTPAHTSAIQQAVVPALVGLTEGRRVRGRACALKPAYLRAPAAQGGPSWVIPPRSQSGLRRRVNKGCPGEGQTGVAWGTTGSSARQTPRRSSIHAPAAASWQDLGGWDVPHQRVKGVFRMPNKKAYGQRIRQRRPWCPTWSVR